MLLTISMDPVNTEYHLGRVRYKKSNLPTKLELCRKGSLDEISLKLRSTGITTVPVVDQSIQYTEHSTSEFV